MINEHKERLLLLIERFQINFIYTLIVSNALFVFVHRFI